MKTLNKLIILLLLPLSAYAGTLHVDPTHTTDREWEGWGVSLCWWANMCGRHSEAQLDSLIEWLTSPQQLNYTLFRYNIGGGDDPQWQHCTPHHMGHGKGLRAEMEGFLDAPTDSTDAFLDNPYHWERDQAQRRIMLMIHRKRPDAVFEAFSNSAPWWMTKSGCVGGGQPATADNLRDDMYGTFSRYLVDVCRHYHDTYGITFRTLEPFNEPLTDYWPQNGSQEGCHFSSPAQVRLIRTLYPILQQSGLSTVLAASDETSVWHSISNFRHYAHEGIMPLIGQWNTHTYSANDSVRRVMRHLADSCHIRLWQSETGDGGRGLHGNLMMARRLISDIRHLQPSAWLDWQYVEENHDQWSLVKCDKQWGTFERHKNFYVRQHFSRFIPAGYRWISLDSDSALAAIDSTGRHLTVVILNTERQTSTTSLAIPGKWRLTHIYRTSRHESMQEIPAKAKDRQVTLPPNSIATLLLEL